MKDIPRVTRKRHATEEEIRIVLEGLRGEYSIAELCRREGIAQSPSYNCSKEFLKAGKKRLAGDTARQSLTPISALWGVMTFNLKEHRNGAFGRE